MTPGKYDLNIYKGDSYKWRFTLWADADRTVPVDLTGATAAAEIRDRSGGTVIVALELTFPDPGINVIEAALSNVDSARCPAKALWDLQVTFPEGDVQTMVAGSVVTTADITDSDLADRGRP
jgi:hypothetical protein